MRNQERVITGVMEERPDAIYALPGFQMSRAGP